ncbi:hypothetical protein G6F22_013760 [Rhizopus arrhizus]|nr:hypothetical protein G6F22_013760 [Rhizopus arrhizus]
MQTPIGRNGPCPFNRPGRALSCALRAGTGIRPARRHSFSITRSRGIHEISSHPDAGRRRRRGLRGPGRRADSRRHRLAATSGTHRRALPGRIRDRPDFAPAGRRAGHRTWPALRRGSPSGRRGRNRQRLGSALGAGRLHAADGWPRRRRHEPLPAEAPGL